MGLSGSTTKTTQTTGPSEYAKPYVTSAANSLQDAFAANRDNAAAVTTGLNNAFNSLSGNLGADLGAARAYNNNLLTSDYAPNPFLDSMIAQTDASVMDRVNAQFSRAGQVGSSAQIGSLGRELANAENNLRFTDYNTWLGNQNTAVQNAANLSNAANAQYQPRAGRGGAASTAGTSNATGLANAMAGLMGGYNTTTGTQTSGGGLGRILGSALGAVIASDRRLKRDVVKVGELADGLGVYDYRYAWSDAPQRGVMADEVARLRPWALGPEIGGFATVDYGAL
jgi:hypothetical protein